MTPQGHDSVSHEEDHVAVAPHSPEEEIAHAKQHLLSDCKMFAVFFSVIVLTVATWNINFGPVGNKFFVYFTAALRSGLIAYYMLSLFKQFSLIKSTFIFSAIFLAGMVFLSWWDSDLVDHNGHGLANPIWNSKDPAAMRKN